MERIWESERGEGGNKLRCDSVVRGGEMVVRASQKARKYVELGLLPKEGKKRKREVGDRLPYINTESGWGVKLTLREVERATSSFDGGEKKRRAT